MRIGGAVFGLAVALGVGVAGLAGATTLADLNGGQSLSAGGLTFSDFSVTVTGALDHTLADYTVLTLADGFKIVGGFGVFDQEQGDMLITYDVKASEGSPVKDVGLAFNGVASGEHSGATVAEDLNGGAITSSSVFALATGGSRKSDSETFSPVSSFSVDKDIFLKAGNGGMATISFITQTFSVVPEPGTLLLLGSGLAGLVALGRKRES